MLGCVQPGESVGQFADALKRLSGQATHLYVEGAQYWYSLQPNVTRVAADRAASNFTDRDADDEVARAVGAAVAWGVRGDAGVRRRTGRRTGRRRRESGWSCSRRTSRTLRTTPTPRRLNSPGRSSVSARAVRVSNRNLVVFVAAAANRLAELARSGSCASGLEVDRRRSRGAATDARPTQAGRRESQ